MSNLTRLFIIGAGGAGVEAIWVARRMNQAAVAQLWDLVGVIDDNPQLTGQILDGVPVIGTLAQFVAQSNGLSWGFHCAIGSNRQRQKVATLVERLGGRAVALVDPTAVIADSAAVGEGSYVGPYSIVAPHAQVGRHVLINTHVGVGHHATIGDFSQLCPGVRVNGGCKVDKGVFLGSNAVVHPGQTIGEGASVGANSFVIRSVKPRFSVLGVPARIVSRPAENGPDAQV